MKKWVKEYESDNKALEIMPEDEDIELNKARRLIHCGIDLLKLDEYDQAMIKANEAISIIENKKSFYYSDALALKATIYMFTKNYNESLKYFNMAFDINPNQYLYDAIEELIKLMK